ncbi:MAG: hypothetical protein QE284_06705, partial [Rhizobium sp.]|nr:hypothetical protein [Rhizobium sp.]
MSIEDPRLSSFDNNASADDFDSAVEQHLGYVSDETRSVEVAQATTPDVNPDAPKTDRLPAETAAATIPTEVVPDQNNVVALPVGVSIDDIRLEGGNLILVQADGTEIVVVGGAVNIPTFVIGEVELPQQALFAALEGNNINVAAGPDGSFSASTGSPSNGGDFNDDPIGGGPEQFALADLLGDTNFGDGLLNGQRLGDDGEPTILEPLAASFIYDEEVVTDNVLNDRIITGTLPFEAGPDFGSISGVTFTGATDVDEGDGLKILTGFTSGGRAITVTSFAAPTDGADLDFLALEGRDSEGNLVFTLTITDRTTGDFTFELVGKLEHPDAGANGSQDDLDDLLRLGFQYTVTDLDGDFVTGTFNIDVQDDAPTFGAAANGAVDEDDLYNGNGNNVGEGDIAFPPSKDVFEKVVAFEAAGPQTSGSLGINWGADNGNAGGNAGLTGTINDRGVAFTSATIAALEGRQPALTSDGVALTYVLSEDGTTLYAYKQFSGEPEAARFAVLEEGGDLPIALPFDGELVFSVSVSDIAANGTYEFQLVGNLDHPDATREDDLAIEFVFTAQDGDGDTASSSFIVTVNDDSPEISFDPKPVTLRVDEDDIQTATSVGTMPNDGNVPDGSYTGTPGVNTGGPANATSMFDLYNLVNVGADQNLSFSFVSAAEVRSYLEGLGLKSNGLPLGFDLSETGTITGFVNSQAPGQAVPGQVYDVEADRLVFKFELNEDGTVSFSLFDQLDHAKPSDGLSSDQNTLTIDFGAVLQATDNDDDSVKLTGLVKVDVTDDVPVIATNAKAITVKVDEDDIQTITSAGNASNDGNAPDGSFTGTPGVNSGGPANATSTVNLSSLVNVGADESVSFSLISTSAMRTYLQGLNLKSNGLPLGFDLSETGTIIGFVNSQAPGQAVPGTIYDEGDDRLVFEFTLNSNGTVSFSLSDQLDHTAPAVAGTAVENTLTIDFGAVLQATDKDGDSVKLTNLVKVDVTDDVPVIATNAAAITVKVDEDDIQTSTSVGNASNDGNVPDGSYTGTPGVNTGGPANATSTVNLSSLVTVGADESVRFSLISTTAMRTYLEGLNLKSNGSPLGFDLRTDGTII